MKKKLFKNISWLFFDKIIRIIGGLFIGIWVARYLGPKDFGLLNYALAYTAFFTIFVKLGLDQILIREVVKKPKLTNYIMGTAFGLKFLGSIIAVILLSLSLYYLETDSLTKIIIFIISVGFIFNSVDVIDFFYQSKILSRYVVIVRNSAFLISAFFKVYLIIYEYNVIYFAVINTLEFFLAGLFLIIIYKKTGYKISKWRYSNRLAKKLLLFSWPLALSTFLIIIYTKVDQVMIGNMLNNEQVGIYSIAVRLSEAWLFVPAIIISTLMPYFIKLRESNNNLYHIRLTQLYSLMFWMGVFISLLIYLFGQELILLLYGNEYKNAYLALVFNIWSSIAISQGLARGIWLIGENLQKYRLYNNIIGVILNIILNMILIPKYGIIGAAIATLATQSLGPWFFSFLWKPLRASTWAMIKSINPLYLILYKR